MSKVVSFKPQVNSTMEYFFKRLDELFADKDQVCNFAFWLQAFAFDVIGEVTFSNRIGFLEKGEDIDGIIGSIWKYFTAASPVGHPPRSGTIDCCFVPIPSMLDMHQRSPNIDTTDTHPRLPEIHDSELLMI